MKSKLPKSKAKTAYGLLSEVRAVILAEPLRYNQRDVLTIIPISDRENWHDAPACGTIGCVAGWVCALKASKPLRVIAGDGVLNYAQRRLGLTSVQRYELFGAYRAGLAERGPEHAKAGAKHIAAFQKANRAQLLAKKV